MITDDDQIGEDVTLAETTTDAAPEATQTSKAPTLSSSSAAPVANPTPGTVPPMDIAIQPRTGVRKLRGKPTSVPTGHLDIMVDGKQRAWTRTEMGAPIRALAEFLPHEIPQLQDAVVAYRGDESVPDFRPLPKGTNEEIAKLKS